jgi:hypothetical protein
MNNVFLRSINLNIDLASQKEIKLSRTFTESSSRVPGIIIFYKFKLKQNKYIL